MENNIKESIKTDKVENIKIPEKPYELKKDRGFDDKDLVIIISGIIAICAMIFIPNPINIISSIITGLFGLATGVSISKK